MKKTVALLLALVMALTATLAFAEPAEAPKEGMVLASDITIDRDRVDAFMDAQNVGEETRGIVDSLLAVVNATADQLTIAENGIVYEAFMKDAEVLCLTFGKTEEGLVILSNLMPGHALTVSSDIVDVAKGLFGISREILAAVLEEKQEEAQAEAEEITDAMIPYLADFVADVIPAIHVGGEEKGAFTFENGASYNTCLRIDIDVHGVAEALNAMFEKMSKDEKVLAALEKVSITAEELADSNLVAENVPAVDIALYANLGDAGEVLSPDRAIAASITLPGQSDAFATFEHHQSEDSWQALLDIPGSDGAEGVSAALEYAPFDDEIGAGGAALQVNYRGSYYGDVFTIKADGDEGALVAENALYIQDPENPLATAVTVIQGGVPALDLSIGDRHAIPVEQLLIGEESEALAQELMRDVVISGLGIIGTATAAVPEFANLLALLNTAETEEAA